jgi:hypothetical protein
MAVAETDTGCALPPAVTFKLATFTESEKLGLATAAVTVSEKEAVWLSVPDVPVNTTVEVPAAADAAAVKFTCCGVPGVRVKLAGDAVTPVGRPLIVTGIVPVNPLMAVAETDTGRALPPAVTFKLVTFTESEKFGLATAAVTVSEKEAVWLSVPDVPVKTTVEVPAAADAAAVKFTCCGVPGVSVKLAGDAVTPVGRPLIVTGIVPVNPLMAVAETDTGCALPPAVKLRLVALTESEKSGVPSLKIIPLQPQHIPARPRTSNDTSQATGNRPSLIFRVARRETTGHEWPCRGRRAIGLPRVSFSLAQPG